MRAAVLNSIDEQIIIRDDVEVLGPGPGEVRVAVRAAGVCHSDLSARGGGLPQPVPAILGHEAAGEVIAVGEGAGFEVGDRVIASWLPPCGTCNSCLRGEPYLCMTHVMTAYMIPRFTMGDAMAFGMAGVGAFAQELVIPAAAAIRIADDVPYEIAALVGCGVMTGVGAVINTAKVPPGATVAVIGCGGVGISAIQGARVAGAAVIVGVDTVEAKHEAALRFGATHAGHPDRVSQLIQDLTGGEGFDYVFEVVGVPQTIRAAWAATRRGGSVVIVGAGRSDQQVEFTPFELLFEGKTMVPSLYGSADIRRDCTRVLNLWRAGRLDLEGMITQRLKLDDVEEALGALGRGDVVRQVIIHD
ncbi:MAG TPA: Zn-dependent alcohol dehydrogenase [Candidatus Limnocylindrales bacterium]|nr:Zn-dependent alcohol dehydrogenase [Candidatus Limnocylindrales bacterium]